MISVPVGSAEYPARLIDLLGAAAPEALSLIGDPGILARPFTAWFCSERLSADLVLPALDRAIAARNAGELIASGFHSPVERQCLELLLRGDQPVIVWPAREIGSLRLPRTWQAAIEGRRMLVVSAHGRKLTRVTAASAQARNRMVAALARRVFVVSVSPGGRVHALARELSANGRQIACFDHPSNEDLLFLGATPVPLQERAAGLTNPAVLEGAR